MAGVSYHRRQSLDRIRPVLRVSISLSDAIDVLSLGALCLAEPVAHGVERLSRPSPVPPGGSVRAGNLSADAAGVLSGLSRHRGRPGLVRFLVALDGAPDHAHRSDVVLVVFDRLERVRRCPPPALADRTPIPGGALR